MPETPHKQPVAAEKGWVDVYFLSTARYDVPPSTSSCAVERSCCFQKTVEQIMAEGICREGGKTWISPSAILTIIDRGPAKEGACSHGR